MSRNGMEFNKGGAIGPTYGVGEGAREGAGDGVGGGPTLASAASDAVAVDERWPAGSDHGCQTSAAMASRITSTRAMGPRRTGIGWTGVSKVIGGRPLGCSAGASVGDADAPPEEAEDGVALAVAGEALRLPLPRDPAIDDRLRGLVLRRGENRPHRRGHGSD